MSRSAEASFLAAVLSDPGLAVEHGDIPSLVFDRRHRLIWEGIRSLLDKGIPISSLSVRDELELAGTLEEAGGAGYLARLDAELPADGYAPQAVDRIWDGYHRRRLVELAEAMKKAAGTFKGHGRELYSRAVTKLQALDLEANGTQGHISEPLKILTERYSSPNAFAPPGIPTGIRRLDDVLGGGFEPRKLYILGGHPGEGKTAAAVSFINHIALHAGEPVGFASLEMTETEIGLRLVSVETGIDFRRLRSGTLTEAERARVLDGLEALASTTLHLTNAFEPAQLFSWARRLVSQGKLKVLLIDYLQRLGTDASFLFDFVRRLANFGSEQGIAVVLLAQISERSRERQKDGRPVRPGFRPQLGDTAWAPSCESHADAVLYVHRPERYYDPYSDPDNAKPGEACFIVSKQRNGPEGDVWTTFISETMRFT
jgi:replicative DNA helicase